MAIIDPLSILPSMTILNSGFRLFKLFRLIRTFRILRFVRYSKSIRIIIEVLKKEKNILMTEFYLAF